MSVPESLYEIQLPKAILQSWERAAHDILGWWKEHMIDYEEGGFLGRIDGKLNKYPQSTKGVILNTRILWTFSFAAITFKDQQYKELAERAYQYLKTHFWDERHGGVFWEVDWKGNCTMEKKQIYAQAFAIYAFCEYYKLSGEEEALFLAQETYWLIEKYSLDAEKGGYLEAFSREWKLLDDLRLSDKDANEAKTMNTHLHVLEAYTALYKTDPQPYVKVALRKLVDLFLQWFIHPYNAHLQLFFDPDWKLKSEVISFGHDIETSWLLWEAIECLDDPSLKQRCLPICIKMATATQQEGMDLDGGIFNESYPNGILDSDKHWWPQAEAIVGFLNAYQLSGRTSFLGNALRVWEFIQENIIDPNGQEWYWMVDQAGNPDDQEDRAGPWKAPYHNVRALIEAIRRCS